MIPGIFNPMVMQTSDVPFLPDAIQAGNTSSQAARGAALTGLANSANVTFSMWFKATTNGTSTLFTGGGGVQGLPTLVQTPLSILRSSANKLVFTLTNAGGGDPQFPGFLDFSSTQTYTTTNNPGWHHVIMSVSSSAQKSLIYVDGTSILNNVSGTTTVKFTTNNWRIGGNTAGDAWGGRYAEMFFTTKFIDLTVSSNLQKFIAANGAPVNLGDDGSLPFGSQPILYLSGNSSTFFTNKGTGGNFSITSGSFSSATGPRNVGLG